MTHGEDLVPLGACTLPGAVTLAPRAIALLERFQKVVPTGWIAAFAWYESGGTRASKDAPLVETGPGLDLGGYRIDQIPREAIWQLGALRFSVLISEDVLAVHPKKIIDLDDDGKLALR